MTGKEFLNSVTHSKKDFLQEFLHVLKKNNIPFCVIGGLAVNAYAEPVVSLDLDVVVVLQKLELLLSRLPKNYRVKHFAHSVNLEKSDSDLRLQIQTDMRYEPFITRAVVKNVLGYKMPVARIEDVLQGKVWSVMDKTRRPSKRQKDLADILRLMENKKSLLRLVPPALREKLEST